MTKSALSDFLEDVTRLENMFPGITQEEPGFKQKAIQLVLASGEPLVALPGPAKSLALPDPNEKEHISVDEDDELIDLHAYWKETYDCKMIGKGDLEKACICAYEGRFGGLPAKVDVVVPNRFNTFQRHPASVYPRTWLSEFLEAHRINYPRHWSEIN